MDVSPSQDQACYQSHVHDCCPALHCTVMLCKALHCTVLPRTAQAGASATLHSKQATVPLCTLSRQRYTAVFCKSSTSAQASPGLGTALRPDPQTLVLRLARLLQTGTLPGSWGSEGYFGPLLSFLNLTGNKLTGAPESNDPAAAGANCCACLSFFLRYVALEHLPMILLRHALMLAPDLASPERSAPAAPHMIMLTYVQTLASTSDSRMAPAAGAIPKTWGSQIDGQSEGQFTLDLSSNSLSGSIPDTFDGGKPCSFRLCSEACWHSLRQSRPEASSPRLRTSCMSSL